MMERPVAVRETPSTVDFTLLVATICLQYTLSTNVWGECVNVVGFTFAIATGVFGRPLTNAHQIELNMPSQK